MATNNLRHETRKLAPSTVLWEARAKNLIKSELKRVGLGYEELADRLSDIGVRENARNLNNKINRGGFSAAFLLQCLSVIGAMNVRLEWPSDS